MLNRDELNRFGPPGFNAGQKEKDYVQHWILSYLAREGFGGVFKGGTCLQKAFNLPRYSEDLDFTLDAAPAPDLEALAAFLRSTGITITSIKKDEHKNAITAKLRYRGPLYNGVALSEGTITLDLSMRENAALPPKAMTLTPPYPDILPYSIRTMHIDEIADEKIRAIMTRESARDLFDLYFLIRAGATLDREVVDRKLSFYGISFDLAIFEKHANQLKKIWKKELDALTPSPIDYETAYAIVMAAVRKQLRG